jgi:hypothetical protein
MSEITFDLLGWRIGQPAISLQVGKNAILGRLRVDRDGIGWFSGEKGRRPYCIEWREMTSFFESTDLVNNVRKRKRKLHRDQTIPATAKTIVVKVLERDGDQPIVSIKPIRLNAKVRKTVIGTFKIASDRVIWRPWNAKRDSFSLSWRSFKDFIES